MNPSSRADASLAEESKAMSALRSATALHGGCSGISRDVMQIPPPYPPLSAASLKGFGGFSSIGRAR